MDGGGYLQGSRFILRGSRFIAYNANTFGFFIDLSSLLNMVPPAPLHHRTYSDKPGLRNHVRLHMRVY